MPAAAAALRRLMLPRHFARHIFMMSSRRKHKERLLAPLPRDKHAAGRLRKTHTARYFFASRRHAAPAGAAMRQRCLMLPIAPAEKPLLITPSCSMSPERHAEYRSYADQRYKIAAYIRAPLCQHHYFSAAFTSLSADAVCHTTRASALRAVTPRC